MIEFIEVQSKESLGTVELKDGKLVGPIHLQSMIQAWLRQEKSPEEFMEFYGGDGWSNGYIYSQVASGEAKAAAEEVPVEEMRARIRTFAQNDEELSPVTVVEKLRDIVAEDVKAHPEVGAAGAEVMREMDNYVELITEAETDEDVRDIIEDILEEVPVADYDGAEDIVDFLEAFLEGGEKPVKEEKPAKEEPAKTLRVTFPRPIKK
ncbi:hypothetical protein M1E17_09265 [Arthrobacter sp. D1-29]